MAPTTPPGSLAPRADGADRISTSFLFASRTTGRPLPAVRVMVYSRSRRIAPLLVDNDIGEPPPLIAPSMWFFESLPDVDTSKSVEIDPFDVLAFSCTPILAGSRTVIEEFEVDAVTGLSRSESTVI